MILKKIQNDDSGHSVINFVTVVLVIMCLSCAFLDLTNLVRLRSVVTRASTMLVEHCTVQSGFDATTPDDWREVYKNLDYWTSTIAYNQAKSVLSKTNANKDTIKVTLKNNTTGSTINLSPGNPCLMQFQEEGELTVECKYYLGYLKAFGLQRKEFTCKVTNPVVAFWVHKTTTI